MIYSKHIIFVLLSFVFAACVTVQPKDSTTTTTVESTPKATAAQNVVAENATPLPSPASIEADASAPISFQGNVLKDEIFEEAISDSLLFRLNPIQHGWEIWIGDTSGIGHNFSAAATPPFRGINARYIEGWHFRNSDNSGPNEAGEKNVNAPQYEREFCLFLKEPDYQIANSWLNGQQLSSDEERQELEEKYSQLRPRAGLLRIHNFELGNLTMDEQAWIESMEFKVELRFNEECPLY